MFWSTGCSLLRAEGFFCSLDDFREALGISKLQFLSKKKILKNFSCIFYHNNEPRTVRRKTFVLSSEFVHKDTQYAPLDRGKSLPCASFFMNLLDWHHNLMLQGGPADKKTTERVEGRRRGLCASQTGWPSAGSGCMRQVCTYDI